MKKNDLVQIKGLDIGELSAKAKALKKEIKDLVFDKNMKKLKDIKVIFKKRKDLAQILTVKRQKELLEKLSVLSKSVTDKQKTGNPKSENRKQKTDNRKKGTKQ